MFRGTQLWAIFMAKYQIWRMDVIKNKPGITACFAGYIYRLLSLLYHEIWRMSGKRITM